MYVGLLLPLRDFIIRLAMRREDCVCIREYYQYQMDQKWMGFREGTLTMDNCLLVSIAKQMQIPIDVCLLCVACGVDIIIMFNCRGFTFFNKCYT